MSNPALRPSGAMAELSRYEWVILTGRTIHCLPDAGWWQECRRRKAPGPGLLVFWQRLDRDDPVAECRFRAEISDGVWAYDYQGQGRRDMWGFIFISGTLAIRAVPSPLILNGDLSMVDEKNFEITCFTLAGRKALHLQKEAPISLTMRHLAQHIKDAALAEGLLASCNQEIRIFLNGAPTMLTEEVVLLDWLRQEEEGQ